jgi:uracil-DNA glycosylase
MTTLHLDLRQRAMLAEMGIRLPDPLPRAATPLPATHVEEVVPRRAGPEAVPVRLVDPPAPPMSRPMSAVAPASQAGAEHVAGELDGLTWEALQAHVAGCDACGLCATRRNAVFGVGDPQADWLVVGEFPSEDEDLQGEPFLGEPGRLLDNMLRSVGVGREQGAFLTLVLKCRPPANRPADLAELAHCEAILRRQVELVQPRVILAMGRLALQVLVGGTEPLGRVRGRAHAWNGVPVVATYHPAYLLRNPADKARAWADLCLAMELAGS